jgi:hypothetical protein
MAAFFGGSVLKSPKRPKVLITRLPPGSYPTFSPKNIGADYPVAGTWRRTEPLARELSDHS